MRQVLLIFLGLSIFGISVAMFVGLGIITTGLFTIEPCSSDSTLMVMPNINSKNIGICKMGITTIWILLGIVILILFRLSSKNMKV